MRPTSRTVRRLQRSLVAGAVAAAFCVAGSGSASAAPGHPADPPPPAPGEMAEAWQKMAEAKKAENAEKADKSAESAQTEASRVERWRQLCQEWIERNGAGDRVEESARMCGITPKGEASPSAPNTTPENPPT